MVRQRKKPGRPRKPRPTDKDIRGGKFIRRIVERLRPLHWHQDCPNRRLHYDEYVAYLLLYFFTPVITSMRGLQQASDLPGLQRKLGLPRFSLGSFSEAADVFDPERLVPIIGELRDRLSPLAADDPLAGMDLDLTAVDGTLIHAMPKMVWALWLDEPHRAAKVHLQFDLLKSAPVAATVTEGNGNERTVLAGSLAAGKLYVLDRGYADYSLANGILEARSSFVLRLHTNATYDVVEERPITPEAADAKVTKDLIVTLGGRNTPALHGRRIRLVELHVPDTGPRPTRRVSSKKTFRTASTEQTILLATDHLDLPAELIALIYRYRWQIELFFRWFKKVLNADRLLSLSPNGLTLVTYCALIASLLLVLWTGRKPTKRTYELFCFYLTGWADEHDILAHLRTLAKTDR